MRSIHKVGVNIVMLIRYNWITTLHYVELRSRSVSAGTFTCNTPTVTPMPCRCGDNIFGKTAAERWSRLMQYAEGPEAFEIGYQKMKMMYAEDAPRLAFIEELYLDTAKAHFKRALSFTNATLVDACETLFSALKTWVMGNQRTSTTLLMAVVRLAKGIQRMVMRSYLKNPKTVKKDFTGTVNTSMKNLFTYLANHLTSSAVRTMHAAATSSWDKYELEALFNGDTNVSNRLTDDEFIVKQDYTCWCNSVRCWHQVYKGFLCNHALLVCLRNITDCGSDKGAQTRLMQRVVQTCNKIWHRSTYAGAALPIRMPDPPMLRDRHVCRTTELDEKEASYILRFQEVMHFVSDASITAALNGLETLALQAGVTDLESTMHDTDNESVASTHSKVSRSESMISNEHVTSSDDDVLNEHVQLSFSNPRKRVRKGNKYRNK